MNGCRVSRPPSEDELLGRACAGDGAAFAALVREHQEIAFRTVKETLHRWFDNQLQGTSSWINLATKRDKIRPDGWQQTAEEDAG